MALILLPRCSCILLFAVPCSSCAPPIVRALTQTPECMDEGSYTCQCAPGFHGDGYSCTDLDECAQAFTCDNDTECTNTPGSYVCACTHGIMYPVGVCFGLLDPVGRAALDQHADCTAVKGSLYCSCQPGFTGNGTYCYDLDECSEGGTVCHPISMCHNTFGSYWCQCLEGYEGNGTACYDINECHGNDTCPANSTCVNVAGAHFCQCSPGFTGNDSLCEDIDECLSFHDDSPCTNGLCNNTVGSFQCVCDQGFQSNGTSCTDIDECILGLINCGNHSICVNTAGSYECSCHPGFTANGTVCMDTNECQVQETMCHSDAFCNNTLGDGYACSDVDECQVDATIVCVLRASLAMEGPALTSTNVRNSSPVHQEATASTWGAPTPARVQPAPPVACPWYTVCCLCQLDFLKVFLVILSRSSASVNEWTGRHKRQNALEILIENTFFLNSYKAFTVTGMGIEMRGSMQIKINRFVDYGDFKTRLGMLTKHQRDFRLTFHKRCFKVNL
uniref:EGF-like domain-containing protein n=1 Tax=Erpetoichthys calabaricus TaxID=27687 RepID=A0A8C4T909_ERPCA